MLLSRLTWLDPRPGSLPGNNPTTKIISPLSATRQPRITRHLRKREKATKETGKRLRRNRDNKARNVEIISSEILEDIACKNERL